MSSSNKSSDSRMRDLQAAIKIWIFMERARSGVPTLIMIGLPEWLPLWNGSVCDAAVGPCSCGAWHQEGERRQVLWT